MSPESAGDELLDDGTTMTFLTRFRPPCPNDPQPMPMQVTTAFVLAKNATRVFAQQNCTPPRSGP